MPKKKKFIQVAGNPEYATPINQNERQVNPLTGTEEFGSFPDVPLQARPFAAGPIFLKYGKHVGPNRGYGLEHIWAEHYSNYQTPKAALPAVAAFVCAVLSSGATIHYEGGVGTAGNRTTIFKNATGVVVVQATTDGLNRDIYNIVTAFKATKANGPVIGAIA